MKYLTKHIKICIAEECGWRRIRERDRLRERENERERERDRQTDRMKWEREVKVEGIG